MDISKDIFQVDAEIARAWTLPAQLYTDPSILLAEKERIFSRTWQVVGHRSQVANPGDYFTTELLGEPLLLVRGVDAELRGFYNVCRHRAGPPAEGCGSRKLFRCGYHGWTYGLDGSLLSATEIEGVEGFQAEDFALQPVRTEEWFNLVFVNLDPRCASTAGESWRVAEAGGEISVRRDEVVRAPHLRHEVQLEDVCGQLSRGISPAQRASRPESRTGFQRLRG